MDLIAMAAWKDHSTVFDRAVIEVKRGQVPTSERRLAERWRWSRGKVRRFLTQLERDSRVVSKPVLGTAHRGTMITLCKYDTYQADEPAHDTAHEPRDGPRTDHTEERERGERKVGGSKTTLPSDWTPADSHRERAVSEGVDLTREAELFRNHHLAKGSEFVNWDRAFTNWLIRASGYNRGRGPKGAPDLERLT